MNNQNIISNKFDLNWSTSFSYNWNKQIQISSCQPVFYYTGGSSGIQTQLVFYIMTDFVGTVVWRSGVPLRSDLKRSLVKDALEKNSALLKNVNKCLNTNINSYLETSGVKVLIYI